MPASLLAVAFAPALLAPQAGELPRADRPFTELRLAIAPDAAPLAACGPATMIEWTAGYDTRLFAWLEAEGLELCLRLELGDGSLIAEDDDRGSGWRPCVWFDVEQGQELRIISAAKRLAAPGAIVLHLSAAPESEETKAAAAHGREGLAEIERLRGAGALDEARAGVSTLIEALLDTPGIDVPTALMDVLLSASSAASGLGLLPEAIRARSAGVEQLERVLPASNPNLLGAQQNLGNLLAVAGRLWEARRIHETVVAEHERVLPDDDPGLQKSRMNLANVLASLGELQAARELLETVLAVDERRLPSDHNDLLTVRLNLANVLESMGELGPAQELAEEVLAARLRAFPADHLEVQYARSALANVLNARRRLRDAQDLVVAVLEAYARALPREHPRVLTARGNLATTLFDRGDLRTAREMQVELLQTCLRTLPEDHPDLQIARNNLALTLFAFGDLYTAKRLQEDVLAARTRILPEDHPQLQGARLNLAATLQSLGDVHGARELMEKQLQVLSRVLPEDHPMLQSARLGLADNMAALGDLEGARQLERLALDALAGTVPKDDLRLQAVRLDLTETSMAMGDWEGARRTAQEAFEVLSSSVPEDHPQLSLARMHLASVLDRSGKTGAASEIYEQSLEVLSRIRPEGHPELQRARLALLWNQVRLDRRERAAELGHELATGLSAGLRGSLGELTPHELEQRAILGRGEISALISLVLGAGAIGPVRELERPSLELVESARVLGLLAAVAGNAASGDTELERLREEEGLASAELARLAQGGAGRDELNQARYALESLRRERLARLVDDPGVAALLAEPEAEALSAHLSAGDAMIGYWRFTRGTVDPDGDGDATESLLAFVVQPGGRLDLVDLGPIATIVSAVSAWRDALQTPVQRGAALEDAPDSGRALRARGERLRELVFDPLRALLAEARHLLVALDDEIHAVPLDALPDGDGLLGERFTIELHASLRELLWPPRPLDGEPVLVALGGASFNSEPESIEPEGAPVPVEASAFGGVAAVLRGGSWDRGFDPLPSSGPEARSVAALFAEVFGERAESFMLEKHQASRESVSLLVPRARYLHLATHGWFAPESVASTVDPQPVDAKLGLGRETSRREQVLGTAPMLLCGLAFSGANLPKDALDRVPGLVTAEEISSWDLRRCELAVLSACNTNVGVRRAGQGVASLQKALHMAGARSVVTSLWKVPDEATRELMQDFYRRLWVQEKPKWQALWEAKLRLRAARDSEGRPLHSTRDWAGWVLSGDPE